MCAPKQYRSRVHQSTLLQSTQHRIAADRHIDYSSGKIRTLFPLYQCMGPLVCKPIRPSVHLFVCMCICFDSSKLCGHVGCSCFSFCWLFGCFCCFVDMPVGFCSRSVSSQTLTLTHESKTKLKVEDFQNKKEIKRFY